MDELRTNLPTVSVVIPCRNEMTDVQACLQSIFENGYAGDIEILVIDGMSNDGTNEMLKLMAANHNVIKVVTNHMRYTPAGLNLGISLSKGNIILILGAHSYLKVGYITGLVKRLLVDNDIGCVGGRTKTISDGSLIQRVISVVLGSKFGVGNSSFRIENGQGGEVDTVAYGAYPRAVFDHVGLFDERLIRNQDIEFSSRLRRAGYKIILESSVEVCYRPRRTVQGFYFQNFGNGFWNIITAKLVPGSLSWRHFVPFACVLALILLGSGALFSPFLRIGLFVTVGLYILLDLIETIRITFQKKQYSLFLIALFFPALHLSYGLGSLWAVIHLVLGSEATSQKRT